MCKTSSMFVVDPGANGAFMTYESRRAAGEPPLENPGEFEPSQLKIKQLYDLKIGVSESLYENETLNKAIEVGSGRKWIIERPIIKPGNSMNAVVRQWEIYAFLCGLGKVAGSGNPITVEPRDWTRYIKVKVREACSLEGFEIDKKRLSKTYLACYSRTLLDLCYGKRGGFKDGRADVIAIAAYTEGGKVR